MRKLLRRANYETRLLHKTAEIPKRLENKAARSDIWAEASRSEGAALCNLAASGARATMRSRAPAPPEMLAPCCLDTATKANNYFCLQIDALCYELAAACE